MKFRNIVPVIVLLTNTPHVYAQDTSKHADGFYNQNALENAKPFAYPTINRNNIEFYRRIWRDIDLADTANTIFATPGNTLIEVILDGVKTGKLVAFDATSTKDNPRGDAFTTALKAQGALGKLQDSVMVPIFDDNGNQVRTEMRLNDFNPATVTKFRVKEDVFFDKQRSRVETRVIGLAPLIKINAAGETVAEQPAFWLYYPDCRPLLATKEIVDPQKNMQKVSFDDIFIQHRFNSLIVKESNPADLSIKDYVDEQGREKESKRIERELEKYKSNIWKY